MQLHSNALKSAGKSIQGAAYLYESLTPFRTPITIHGDDVPEARSLSIHRKRYVTLRPLSPASWAFRYHDTDVVIWREVEGVVECVVQPYASHSTETFAEKYAPRGISFKMHYDHGCFALIPIGGATRVYDMGSQLTLRLNEHGCWAPYRHETKATFVDKDPQAMRAALHRTRYFDFAKWLDAVMTLDAKPNVSRIDQDEADKIFCPTSLLDLLDDPNSWSVLRATSYFRTDANQHSVMARREWIKHRVRDAIYKRHSVIKHREVAWYSASQFNSQRILQDNYP